MENYPRDELLQTDPDDARRDRHVGAAPAGAPQDPAVPALRHLRAVRLGAHLPAPRPLQHDGPAEDGGHPAADVQRGERRTTRPACRSRRWPGCTSWSGCPRARRSREVDESALEREVVEATRTWDEDLVEALRADVGDEAGGRLIGLVRQGVPRGVQGGRPPAGRPSPTSAGSRCSTPTTPSQVGLHQEPGCPPDERRFKLYRRGPLTLTRGAADVHRTSASRSSTSGPTRSPAATASASTSTTSGCVRRHPEDWGGGGDRDARRLLFQNAVRAVWTGAAESDGFNALVLGAGLTWRQVVILRTVAKYLRQTRSTFSPGVCRGRPRREPRRLADAGRAVRDPVRPRSGMRVQAGPERAEAEATIAEAVLAALDEVASLDQDRIIRALLGVVQAALRTNFYQSDPVAGGPQGLRQPQARPDQGARPARAAADVRDLGLRPARRGRPPALRQGRPRRAALVRPAGGLPHRGPRSGQGADGQERRHRPDREQGRVLRQAAARPDRRTATPGWPRASPHTSCSSPACST